MRIFLYPRLAWDGIRKNTRMSVPFLIAGSAMAIMLYIMVFLSQSERIAKMRGGMTVRTILAFGVGIMTLFALVFLSYTHSMLIRRRKKELGLLNVLGLGKREIVRVLILETLMKYVICAVTGILAGILFSKGTELLMVSMAGEKPDMVFRVSLPVIILTLLLYALVFSLILIVTLIQTNGVEAISMMKAEQEGETPPRNRWFFAIGGLVILGAAYVIALRVENPTEALGQFFIAVFMVIVSTYWLFIEGSVVLCNILKRNKRYYYRADHFVPVSSMTYRMKRNGAGLASICILSTMVLVTLSVTGCLFIGTEDVLREQFPGDVSASIYSGDEQAVFSDLLPDAVSEAENVMHSEGLEMSNMYRLRSASLIMKETPDGLAPLSRNADVSIGHSVLLYLIPLSDYNYLTGKEIFLSPNEALLSTQEKGWGDRDTLLIEGIDSLSIHSFDKNFVDMSGAGFRYVMKTIVLVISDNSILIPYLSDLSDTFMNTFGYEATIAFDLENGDADSAAARFSSLVEEYVTNHSAVKLESIRSDVRENVRSEFRSMNGSLFGLGIMLSLVFLFATVLLIYYKQITEGFEDQSRFGIMKKVGMTSKEIRRSVSVQMRIVFLLPVLFALIHLLFAFRMMKLLLMLFGLVNIPLLMTVTAVCFLCFVLLYVFVYRMTALTYFGIVNTGDIT